MAVVGKHCFVFEHTGKTCDVSAFSPNLPITSLPLVDAVIVYDCPYTMQSYLLMIRNALYVDTMQHNLIPPFLMREAGVEVNDIAKIHVKNPDDSHTRFSSLTASCVYHYRYMEYFHTSTIELHKSMKYRTWKFYF